MGNLEDAIEFKPNYLEGQINMDIDFKDIDNNRVFTNEEIGQMSTDEFERLESFINQQVVAGKIMTDAQARQQVQAGNLIYVNSYTRSDGTPVHGYYRSKIIDFIKEMSNGHLLYFSYSCIRNLYSNSIKG